MVCTEVVYELAKYALLALIRLPMGSGNLAIVKCGNTGF